MGPPKKASSKNSSGSKDAAKLPETPPSNKGRAKATPPSPASHGKSPSKLGQSKNTVFIHYEVLQNRILVIYAENAKKFEAGYIANKVMKQLSDDPDEKMKLGYTALLSRRGENGRAIKQRTGSIYDWTQFVWIPASGETETDEKVMAIVEKFLKYVRKSLYKEGYYQFPQKFVLGDDLSRDPPRPLDAALLDDDVLDVMDDMCENMEHLTVVAKDEEIMSTFWTDTKHGRKQVVEFLEAHNWNLDGPLPDSD